MSYFKLDIKQEGHFVIISGFISTTFFRDLQKTFKTSKLLKLYFNTFNIFGKGTLKVHIFFLPELVYILSVLPPRKEYIKLNDLIFQKTWMELTTKEYTSKISLTKINNNTIYSLKPYQSEFIKLYDDKKQKYKLNGYILAFEQGLGKTFTSLALMDGLSKDIVIIVAPKSTLRTVWENEINNVFKNKQDIWVIGQPIKQARFYIVNYESIEKLSLISKFLLNKNTGIIVDECHNFRNVNTKRVINLLSIAKLSNCKDILLMSGTPIKALGTEMIPALDLIDPLFDDVARKIFIKAFGLSSMTALSILKNRLGLIMHRKIKQEVLNLPNKHYINVKIKTSNSKIYTLENVKQQVGSFIKERNKFYEKNHKQFQKDFDECIEFLSLELRNDPEFKFYLEIVNKLKRYGYNNIDRQQVKDVARANKYETNILRPMLSPELKRKFDKSKAVIKYVNLKIMGEVIGGLLNKLRSDMFSDMIKQSPICKIINDSEKKTVCFTTFVDVVKNTNSFINNSCKLDPLLVYGKTSGNIKNILSDFKIDINKNPLIATIQTLSTGVTLVEANTVIFLNQPWRHTDKIQAEDRVHRIGQDVDVNIFTFTLDTGNQPNLSTRMEDIISWSKDMFEGIVGKDETIKNSRLFKRLRGYT